MMGSRNTQKGGAVPGRDRAFLLGLGVAALAVRLAYVIPFSATAGGRVLLLDGLFHDQWARALAAGDWLGSAVFFRAPLYAYLLGGIYALFGPDLLLVRVLQAVMGTASVLLTYRLGRRVFDRTVGRFAALAMALYWIPVYFDGELLITSLILFLDLVMLDRLLTALEGNRRGQWYLAGLVLGISAIARPNVLLFGVVVAAVLVARGLGRLPRLTGRPPLPAGRASVVAAVALAGGALTAILPVTVRNAVVGGDAVLIASQAGINFYLGNHDGASGVSAISEDLRQDWWGGFDDSVRRAEERAGRPLKPSEVSRYWMGEGLRFWLRHPLAAGRLFLKKTHLYWSAWELGNNRDLAHAARPFPALRFSPVRFGWVAPLSLLGVLTLGARDRRTRLLVLFLAAYMLSVVLFFTCTRYRVPTLPVVMVFAGGAAVDAVRRWRRGERRLVITRRLVPALLLALVVVFDPYGVRKGYPAQADFHDGLVLSRDGQTVEAELAYRRAIADDPAYADPHVNLAHLLAEAGRYEEARASLEQAIRLSPGYALAWYNLGVVQESLGDGNAARAAYEQAVALDPGYADAQLRLGLLLERSGDMAPADQAFRRAADVYLELERITPSRSRTLYDQGLRERMAAALRGAGRAAGRTQDWAVAAGLFEDALDLVPDSAEGHYGLAYALDRLGQWARAVAEYHAALAVDPDHIKARYALAIFHSRYGRWRAAEDELLGVLAREPEHQGALYNLGILRAQDGKLEEAIELWERLLVTHPEDRDARRAIEQARAELELRGR
jgi:tetratricopeptide (TPR) repeat protein/4-amino-4-deoxy-L-arabinose transferase-like glycosyltransferase